MEIATCGPEPTELKEYAFWAYPDTLDVSETRLAEFAAQYKGIHGRRDAQRLPTAETLESLVDRDSA